MAFEFGRDLEVQAVWHYYGEGLTQAEIAQLLGVSRTTVANLLASGRQRGLVKIKLAPDLLNCVEVARHLQKRIGLTGAHVVPVQDEGSANEIRRSLARAAAHLLGARLGRQTVLGVASGRTMAALGEEILQDSRPDVQVVQVSGSSLGDEAASPEACTLSIAARLGARGFNFLAPAVVTKNSLRDALINEPALKKHLKKIRTCSVVVFSVGELTSETTWAGSDVLTQAAAPEYMRKMAAGVVIGRFIDQNGKEISGPLSGRQVGASLADLIAIPERICVAGGREKTTALRAAIAGGLITHLVTDTCTAVRLLETN